MTNKSNYVIVAPIKRGVNMFGEELMCGTYKIKIQNKNRINIPASTKAETGDEIAIQKIDDYLKMYPKKAIDKVIEEMQSELQQAKDISESNIIKEKMERFYFSILSNVKCDTQRRIVLPDFFDKNESIEIMAVGCGDHVKLYTLKRYNELSNK